MVTLIEGNIVHQEVESIVNAANNSLLGGGGVDGAIHQAAGPGLLKECREIGGCPTGEARVTLGYQLSCHWVIHTVGPIWSGGGKGEENLLANCYRNCFAIVKERSIKSVAFPSISTGVYRFPKQKASKIALLQTKKFLATATTQDNLERITFVCFSQEDLSIYRESYSDIFPGSA